MWDAFKDLIFQIIYFFYNFCYDWGMAIVIVTIIFRILISPLMHKSTKANFQMQKVQPLMKEIQEKFKDDPVRLQEETQKIYAESHFNPLAGCLPMLLQMPIFMALFQVLNEMSSRPEVSRTSFEFYNLVPNLVTTPAIAMGQGPLEFIPYFILMIVFAGATFLPMMLQQKGNKDDAQRRQMYIMSGVMSLFMLWISWNSPAGVLLFWGASSLIGVAQQQGSMAYMRKQDAKKAEEIEIQPIKVDVERKVKKKRPTKNR